MNTLATVTPTAPATYIRSAAEIQAEVSFDEHFRATVKAGSKLTAVELGTLANSLRVTGESASVKSANVLRLARMLPDSTVDGKPVLALDVAKATLAAACKSESQYNNIVSLIAPLDVMQANEKTIPAGTSPFVLKEMLGTLKAIGALPKSGDSLKLKSTVPGASPLFKTLKEGKATVNGIRPLLKKAKETAEKAALSPEQRAAADKAAKDAATNTAKTEAETYAPERVNRDIATVRGIWEKSVSHHSVEKVRAACKLEIELLAKLAGFDLTPIAPVKK